MPLQENVTRHCRLANLGPVFSSTQDLEGNDTGSMGGYLYTVDLEAMRKEYNYVIDDRRVCSWNGKETMGQE